MITAKHSVGEFFNIQFVWQLPDNGDFIRAVMKAEVLELQPEADKYVVRLTELLGGRQESPTGEPRDVAELTKAYWGLVGQIVGSKIIVAYEAEDGRPLHLRLSTLTGEHKFFHRFDD